MRKDNKTLGVTIRFFTDKLPKRISEEEKRFYFWNHGQVSLEANKKKGIKSDAKLFNCFDDIPRIIKTVLDENHLKGLNKKDEKIKRTKTK